jgi:hypothetical protein
VTAATLGGIGASVSLARRRRCSRTRSPCDDPLLHWRPTQRLAPYFTAADTANTAADTTECPEVNDAPAELHASETELPTTQAGVSPEHTAVHAPFMVLGRRPRQCGRLQDGRTQASFVHRMPCTVHWIQACITLSVAIMHHQVYTYSGVGWG